MKRFGVGVLCLFVVSCSSLDKQLIKRERTVLSMYEDAENELSNQHGRTLQWSEAVSMMQEKNIELQEARTALKMAKQRKSQIFWNLAPSLQVTTSVREALTELSEIDADSIDLGIYSFVNIPGLLSLKAQLYTSELAVRRAEWRLAMKERELTARLREVFLQYAMFEHQEKALSQKEVFTPEPAQTLSEKILRSGRDLEQEKFYAETQRISMNQRIARLIGSSSHKWRLDPKGVARHSYVKKPLDSKDFQRVGVLYRKQVAANLELMRLQELGAKLEYFPDVRMGVSAPPVFQSRGGNSSQFSVEDISVRLSSSLRLDTNRRISRNVKNVKERMKVQKRRLREAMQVHAQRLRLGQKELQLMQKQIEKNAVKLEIMKEMPKPTSMKEKGAYLQKVFQLEKQQHSLILRRARIENAFWILDDSRWKSVAT